MDRGLGFTRDPARPCSAGELSSLSASAACVCVCVCVCMCVCVSCFTRRAFRVSGDGSRVPCSAFHVEESESGLGVRDSIFASGFNRRRSGSIPTPGPGLLVFETCPVSGFAFQISVSNVSGLECFGFRVASCRRLRFRVV